MRPESIDVLLNDTELNYLANLFLSRYGFDFSSPQYRYFRNAVVAFSFGTALTVDEILYLLADRENVSYGVLTRGIETALRDLDRPISETYNKYYAPPPDNDKLRRPEMKARSDIKYIISFLGTVFLYLVHVNYRHVICIDPTVLKQTAAELKSKNKNK